MSDSEWKTGIREGYRTKTIRVGNVIATIHRPILTNEERRDAEAQVEAAMLNFVDETSQKGDFEDGNELSA